MDEIIRLYEQIEDGLLKSIARKLRIDEIGDITQWRIDRLNELGLLTAESANTISKYSGKALDEVERVLGDAGYSELRRDERIYKMAYADGQLQTMPLPADTSPQLAHVLRASVRNTRDTLNMVNTTALQSARQEYMRIVNRVYLETITGVTDYNTAVRRATIELANHGITGADYISAKGRHTRTPIDVAVRRNITTSVSQTTGDMQLERAKEWGTNLIEVTSHLGARPEHALWQGRVYSIEGSTAEYPNLAASTGYGTVTGLKGVNCRHDMFPFFPGISEQAHHPYDLEENQRVYEDTQTMRKLERDVRQQKRRVLMAEETGDAEGKLAAQLKLKEKEALLKKFARESGQGYESSRAQVYGFGHSEANKAVWAQRKEVEKYSAIRYNKDGTIKVTDDWTDKKHPTLPSQHKSNAVIDTVSRGGKQRDRMIYDADGWQKMQINGGNHGHPKKHPYGKNGEHAHDISWDEKGNSRRTTRELTEKERKENSDIL